ncbi:MAG: hypothetical protein ACFFCS_18985 [Candidatus Hodarchaeota archaeon]
MVDDPEKLEEMKAEYAELESISIPSVKQRTRMRELKSWIETIERSSSKKTLERVVKSSDRSLEDNQIFEAEKLTNEAKSLVGQRAPNPEEIDRIIGELEALPKKTIEQRTLLRQLDAKLRESGWKR